MRTAEATNTSCMLVLKGFSLFEHVPNPRHGVRLSAQAEKSFALKLEHMVFGDKLQPGEFAATENAGETGPDVDVVLRNLSGGQPRMKKGAQGAHPAGADGRK